MIRKAPLADWLREARERSGLSQSQVAQELGYSSPQFISNWERGLSSPPIPKFKKLCKLYSLSLDEAYEKLLQATLDEVERKLRKEFYPSIKRRKQ
jgi:transcriptional regulator with XRE-family HTH domain